MPKYNSIEIRICGKKYTVQSNEPIEYVKRIEEIINQKVAQFKSEDKNFDNHSSIIFTAFILADKYLKSIDELEREKNKAVDVVSLGDIKNIKDEKNKIVNELEKAIQENDRILQELIQRNSELEIARNKLQELSKTIVEKEEEIKLLNEINLEQEEKVKQLKKERMMISAQMEFREE